MSQPLEDCIVIAGVGLIGGSLAAALKQRNLARKIIGVGRSQARLDAAHEAGLIDAGSTDLASAAREATLVVCCTPVDRLADDLQLAFSTASAECLLTDAGSIKAALCRRLPSGRTPHGEFIGSHPLAGSHKRGHEAADANLYQNRVCILTPLPSASSANLNRLVRFWQAVGMKTASMTPEEHDRILAQTSHVPHVAASALALTLQHENSPFAATGFRDTTRIAAGEPDIWLPILLGNSAEMVLAIAEMEERLAQFRQAISAGDAATLKNLLQKAKTTRDRLNLDSLSP